MTLGWSAVLTLTWILPWLIRMFCPIYAHNVVSPEVQQDSGDGTVASTSTDGLDVHIAFISWVIHSAAYIMTAVASTPALHLIAVAIIGLSAAHTPIFRSLVVSSVDPLKQGEVLTAIELTSNIGVLLSPIVMGSIFTGLLQSSTVSKFLILTFYVHAAIVIVAASLLFLIKASDRYQKLPRAHDWYIPK